MSQSAPDFLYERYSLLNFTGVIVARIAKKAIVLEVNSPFAIEQGREGYIRAVAVAQWVEKTICNSATHVVVVNESLRAIMIAIGVEEQRLVVMHNGVNLSHFARRNTSSLRARFGLENKLVFGFVGWLRKQHCLVDRRTGLHLSPQPAIARRSKLFTSTGLAVLHADEISITADAGPFAWAVSNRQPHQTFATGGTRGGTLERTRLRLAI